MRESDGVMIARGDLATETLPEAGAHRTAAHHRLGARPAKPTIVATQMLASAMTEPLIQAGRKFPMLPRQCCWVPDASYAQRRNGQLAAYPHRSGRGHEAGCSGTQSANTPASIRPGRFYSPQSSRRRLYRVLLLALNPLATSMPGHVWPRPKVGATALHAIASHRPTVPISLQ